MERVKFVKFAPLSLRKFVDEENGTAALQWSIRMGYPRITVFTGSNIKDTVTGEMNYGKIITAPFDYVNMLTLVTKFKELIDAPNESKYTIECFNTEYKDGKKTDNIYLQARVTVGKDKNGVIYIAATEEEKRKIKFELLPDPKWFKFIDKEGKEITDNSLLSKMYAKSYTALVEKSLLSEFSNDARSEKELDNSKNTKKIGKVEDSVNSELDEMVF